MTTKLILDGDRTKLGEYMRDLADLCGLRDWYLFFSHAEPQDNTNGAECLVAYGQKSATIYFRADWPTWDADRVRSLMVHELLHCHTEPMRWAVNNTKHAVSPPAFEVIVDAFTDTLEVAIDGIAREWAKTLPLPIKSKAKKARNAA